MDISSTTSGTGPDGQERRSQHDLRRIFDDACRITEPFFDSAQGWGGSHLTLYARQTLHEAYPELTQQEVAILLSGVARHHREVARKS